MAQKRKEADAMTTLAYGEIRQDLTHIIADRLRFNWSDFVTGRVRIPLSPEEAKMLKCDSAILNDVLRLLGAMPVIKESIPLFSFEPENNPEFLVLSFYEARQE